MVSVYYHYVSLNLKFLCGLDGLFAITRLLATGRLPKLWDSTGEMMVADEPQQSLSEAQTIAASVGAARSKVVYCHCREGQTCHGDVIVPAFAEAKSEEEHRRGRLPRTVAAKWDGRRRAITACPQEHGQWCSFVHSYDQLHLDVQ